MRKDKRGSFTVEAAFAVPIFVFAVTAFILLFKILLMEIQLQDAMTEASKELSQLAYINSCKGQERTDVFGTQTNKIANNVVIGHEINKYFMSEKKYDSVLSKKISYNASSYINNEEDIDLIAEYSVRIPLPILSIKDFSIIQRVKTRAFIGSNQLLSLNNVETSETAEDSNYVYITETGTVYHVTLECSSLKLKISQCNVNEVESRRNAAGGKYKKCERCCKDVGSISAVYICEDGDRYHCSLECSGLKRSIKRIPLHDVDEKMRACYRCGTKES